MQKQTSSAVDAEETCGSCAKLLCTFLPRDPAQAILQRHVLKRGARLDPDGADWAQVTKESIEIYLEGIAERE